jgi:Holliday junction DNA helicase RuvA
LIVAIDGKVIKKEPTIVYIKTNSGLTYGVNISINTSNHIQQEEVSLHTHYIIREDNQALYGFFELSEKKIFETLIKINGVGPKVALAICSTYTPESFVQIVQANDVSSLKRVPGIGPKSASRILVELSGAITTLQDSTSSSDSSSSSINEAVMALESLGFKTDAINKALKGATSTDTSELVKYGLKQLQK